MIKFSVQQIVAIFMFFLFGSVIFGTLLKKLNQIARSSNNRVAFRERPEFIFYDDDIHYRYPRRNIDINLGGINVSAPPTTAPTPSSTTPDTSNDEAIARALARDLGGEFGTRDFRGSGSPAGDADGSGPAIVGGVLRRRRREGFTNNIEGYSSSSPLIGSPF